MKKSRKEITVERVRALGPAINNVFYFPNLVDVRVAAKCGFANFKKMTSRPPLVTHARLIVEYGDALDLPFRKGSTRFAIKRDPVKRFLSALDYMEQEVEKLRGNKNYIRLKKDHERRLRNYPIDGFKSLEVAVIAMELNTLFNSHFFTQTDYYNDINQYDYVYDLNDFPKAMSHIISLAGEKNIPNSEYWIHVHENKSVNKFSSQLTDDLAERIKILYRVDYDNGWC